MNNFEKFHQPVIPESSSIVAIYDYRDSFQYLSLPDTKHHESPSSTISLGKALLKDRLNELALTEPFESSPLTLPFESLERRHGDQSRQVSV
jgi:hypothetical protein